MLFQSFRCKRRMSTVLWLMLTIAVSVGVSDSGHYETLGVTKQATQQEIRQAFKKLAVKLHPDKNPEPSVQEQFIKISEAYETLKDPEKRRKYDMYGSYPTYGRQYDSHSQSEYNNLYFNGLYSNDLNVDNIAGNNFYNYLSEGFHFINFYSPFCPPCQSLGDHWKKLAEKYKGIIKVGAVNCKYYNSFCYNTMRIMSYPSLLFYPNGKNGHYVVYRNEHKFEVLERFVMSYVGSKVQVPTVMQVQANPDRLTLYIIGESWLDTYTVTRIAYHLKDIASVFRVLDDDLRLQLTKNEQTTVVIQLGKQTKELDFVDENDIINAVVNFLPPLESISTEKLQAIRNGLRNNLENAWVFHFRTTVIDDALLVNKLRNRFSNINFGEIDCDKWSQLCFSLQVDSLPAWAVMKVGGTYERAHTKSEYQDLVSFIQTASVTDNMQTLSSTEFLRITNGNSGLWVLAVIPYQLSWEHMTDAFTKACLHFKPKNIQFGIMMCVFNTDKLCKTIAVNKPAIVVQNGTRRHMYHGHMEDHDLIEFITDLLDSTVVQLTANKCEDILDSHSREETWLIAFMPAYCGSVCEQLDYEWRIVARKMQPLNFVRVGVLNCASEKMELCSTVRSPTMRLYPLASGEGYVMNMQHLSKAPYMLEWAMERIDDSVQKFNRQSFVKTVLTPSMDATSLKYGRPWLVYFHSPRCYRCYEMYTDFAIAGIMLNNAVSLGRVNCLEQRDICHNEQIMNYPSIKLYLRKSQYNTHLSTLQFVPKEYLALIQEIRPHLIDYNDNLLGLDDIDINSHKFGVNHDEF